MRTEEGIIIDQNFEDVSLMREICSRPILSNASKYDGLYTNALSEGSSEMFGLQGKDHPFIYGLG